jgi:aminotransferase
MKQQPGGHMKKKQISERAQLLAPSGIRKFFDLLSQMEGVISLGVGEPDFATPWHIREAAIHSLEQGQTMYTSNAGMPALRKEAARYLKDNYGLTYNPDTEILITVGVSEGLDLATRATLNPGDEVIIPDPCYVSYPACVTLAGGNVIRVATCEESNFELDAAAVEAKITAKTKAIIIGYPSNPTGAVMPLKKMEALGQVARRHNLLLISDEIYAKLTYDNPHVCVAALPDMKDSTVLLGGFSKCYAMTGWRIGYAAATSDIIAAMTKIHQYTIMSAPTMGQVAALEALKNGQRDTEEMVEDYNRRRLIMLSGFKDIGLDCFEPKGAFYTFPSIKRTGLSSEQFAEKLLLEEKVAVVPGTAFGECGEGYIRCCYATSMEEIEVALKRLEHFIKKYNA